MTGPGMAAFLRCDDGTWARLDELADRMLDGRGDPVLRDLQLAAALRVVAAATRSGASLPQALERAAARTRGPVSSALGVASARLSMGASVPRELARFAEQVETPPARLFAQVMAVQHARGGDMAEPCHRLAGLLHERCRLDAEARSATAQARYSARAVVAIPLLLGVVAAWARPEAVRSLAQPLVLFAATPGIALVVAGALLASRIANGATAFVDAPGPAEPARLVRSLDRLAGPGRTSQRSARLACAAAFASTAALVVLGPSVPLGACCLLLVACACAWPWDLRRRARAMRQQVAAHGVEAVLEVSIALFAAGATAHEVARAAPLAAPPPLRAALAPALDRMSLGRGLTSSFADLDVVVDSPALDSWLHAVCTSAELGAPASDALELALRDARAERRERIRAQAATAGPRMQLALVLLVVPGVMWLMLLATVGGLARQLGSSGVLS